MLFCVCDDTVPFYYQTPPTAFLDIPVFEWTRPRHEEAVAPKASHSDARQLGSGSRHVGYYTAPQLGQAQGSSTFKAPGEKLTEKAFSSVLKATTTFLVSCVVSTLKQRVPGLSLRGSNAVVKAEPRAGSMCLWLASKLLYLTRLLTALPHTF